jgi:hypothetical protein
LKELCEKFAPATVCWFVESVLDIVLEKNEKARVMSGGLFAAMVGTRVLNQTLRIPVIRQNRRPPSSLT